MTMLKRGLGIMWGAAVRRQVVSPSPKLLYSSTRPLQSRVGPITLLLAAGVSGAAYSYVTNMTQKEEIPGSPTTQHVADADAYIRFSSPTPALTLSTATAKLRKGERSYRMEGGGRFDVNMLASNCPLEDSMVAEVAPGPGHERWQYWGVYDGHAGWECSKVLSQQLVGCVSVQLSTLPAQAKETTIIGAIKRAFNIMDRSIMKHGHEAAKGALPATPEAVAALKVAMAGSCALLCIYDPKTSTLRTACTGDSRAVLGRYDAKANAYTTVPLSVDQTGFNEAEVARISAAHPGEKEILDPESGRLMGLAVTRAFGDHRWKWSNELVTDVKQKFFGTPPRPQTQTPPYLTAEPEVTETPIQRGEAGEAGDFVILASDGLWDRISSDDAVECVARWLQAEKTKTFAAVPGDDEMAPEVMEMLASSRWQATPEFFVTEEQNAATHLVKNAFGGARRRLFCGVMMLGAPHSRLVRDDVTVQVLFFGGV